METEVKEKRTVVLIRVKPGDRWRTTEELNSKNVYGSLTDALEAWYQGHGNTKFYIDARAGTVEIITEQTVEIPVKKFSLYGEE